MKKNLFLLAAAALAMTACTSESTEYVGDNSPQTREISFTPLATPQTRAAVEGTAFPTELSMEVAAYMVEPTAQNFFAGTTFTYDYAGGASASSGKWGGTTAQYWPLSACYINFLAYTGVTGTATFDSTTPASAATITQSDNSSAQTDLMYARGNGEVTFSENALTIPAAVPMVFKHAQALIKFTVMGSTNVTVNNITLNGAKYSGTYTITHTNYNLKTTQSVAGRWTVLGDAANVIVPGWNAAALTDSPVAVGNGLMIVPDDTGTGDFTSFTINYTLGGKAFNFTYTPTSTNVEQGHKYTYNITFTSSEIFVTATVTDWDNTNTAVSVGS